jgi:hypothetical protein
MAAAPLPESLSVPEWVQLALHSFERRSQPFMEIEIPDALQAARKNEGDLGDAEWRGFLAEHSAFFFMEGRGKESVWGTYFAPWASWKKGDGTDVYQPDIRALVPDTVLHWEERAEACSNPLMRARYSDLVWDLKSTIAGQKAAPEYARLAADSYLEAADRSLYPPDMEIRGVQWLGRALDVSRSINDSDRIKRIVEFMFVFYERVAKPQFPGTWFFLFDNLYGEKFVTPEQESRIITNLETVLSKASDTTATASGVHPTLDPWGAEAAAQRLARHYNRRNDRPNAERVTKAYGSAFQHMAAQASPMLAMAWLQPVIESYEQQGLKAEAEQLQLMAAEKGKNISQDLKQYSVKVEVKQEEIERLVERLIGRDDLSSALGRIAGYFIPKADRARELLEQLRVDTPLMSMIPIKIVASDGHTTARINSLDEDPNGRLHKQLAETIGFHQPFLEHTLSKLRERYSPTTNNVLDFLCQSPLFGEHRDGLLREGLVAYEQGDFVKAVHVLVPQVETVLRNFLGHLGRPTLKTVRSSPGVMDCKSMNEILRDEAMRSALTEDLWRYFEVVYVDKRGLNLRNDVAHGLLSSNVFNRQVADRVFHTLLALSLMRAKKSQEGTV